MKFLQLILAGFVGGLVRGLVGISKKIRDKEPDEKVEISRQYLAITLLSSGGIGLLVGVLVSEDVRFALLAGYAGTDFLENAYKIKMRQQNL